MASIARSFLPVNFPPVANFATAARGVDFDICPPVFEYTSVSSTRMFTFAPDPRTWSSPPKPMSYAQPSPPRIHTLLRTRNRRRREDRAHRANSRLKVSASIQRLDPVARQFPFSLDWSAARSCRDELISQLASQPSAQVRSHTPLRLSTASRMPRPNSALSSNSELDQDGPRPAAFCV